MGMATTSGCWVCCRMEKTTLPSFSTSFCCKKSPQSSQSLQFLTSHLPIIKTGHVGLPLCTRGKSFTASMHDREANVVPHPDSFGADRLAGRLLGPGDEGEGWWDDKCVFHPIVVYDSASSVWRMYYYGRNSDSWHSGVKPALLSTGRVGLALSEDGVHWKRAKGALPEGAILDPDDEGSTSSFDSVHVACGDVFFLNGEWWMFYFGGSLEKIEVGPGGKAMQGLRMLPGLIKSTTGLEFNRPKNISHPPLLNAGKQNEWDEVFIAWPRVIPPVSHVKNKQWLMTYSSIEKQIPPFSSIGAATSTDGVEWVKIGKVLTKGLPGSWDEGGVGRRHVLVIEEQYVMFYEGVNSKGVHGIGLALSTDGIKWEKDETIVGPIFSARIGEDAWDNGTVAAPHVVQLNDGSFRLYYVGANSSKQESAIGLAISKGRDYRSWSRFELTGSSIIIK